jgi:hypothetical protein
MFWTRATGETPRQYSEVSEAAASAIDTALVMCRATHHEAVVDVMRTTGATLTDSILVYRVHAFTPRDAQSLPTLSIVNGLGI